MAFNMPTRFTPESSNRLRHDGRALAQSERRPVDSELEGGWRFSDAVDRLKTMVTERPGWALGAALAAGVIFGWLVKRR